MNRLDLQRLSRLRVLEARALYTAAHFSGSYYLAGYAVELALKACIAKQTKKHDFPDRNRVRDSYVHKPSDLLKVANLTQQLEQAMAADPILYGSWSVVKDWSEESRYRIWNMSDAEQMLRAITARKGGTLPWLQQHW